jgi:hypothetical protein
MSAWSDLEWEGFCALLEEAWPGEFDDAARASWRLLLDGIEPAAASEGLRRMLFSGQRFRPSVSEFLAAVRADPSEPTFDEAVQLIRRALKAPGYRERLRERQRETGSTFVSTDDEDELRKDAIRGALEQMHPRVRGFVATQGVERLHRMLGQVEGEEWGEKHRADLRADWERHVESGEQRELAAIASGGRVGLRELDPLAALGLPRPAGELAVNNDNQRRAL